MPFSDTGVATSAAGVGQFVFNAQTDTLLWDADGTGLTGAVAVSTFATNVTLTAADLFIL
ncbi:hypothetical protein OCOJLMKI_5066 [Methylobacterium iners]|uniref:Uncharacterized protein n=1 Tax=Methylobacterium iners TaxID=418707 RepID=A0ABQ4S7T4_9HYPH|nr:hypothetical protein OCOJLMKI_5066 [Methylobacterium iners]